MVLKVYTIFVNDGDAIPLELDDMIDPYYLPSIIADSLRTTEAFIKVLSIKADRYKIFSIVDLIKSYPNIIDISHYTALVRTIEQKTRGASRQDIFFLWLRHCSPSGGLLKYQKQLKNIMDSYNFSVSISDIDKKVDAYMKNFSALVGQTHRKAEEIFSVYREIQQTTEPSDTVYPFMVTRTQVSVRATSSHSLNYFFDKIGLSTDWSFAVYRDMIRWYSYNKSLPADKMDELQDIVANHNGRSLLLLHKDLEQNITVSREEGVGITETSRYVITIDTKPFDTQEALFRQLSRLFGNIISQVGSYKTESVSGVFYLKYQQYENMLLRDYILNDRCASFLLYVNELEKASFKQTDRVSVRYIPSSTTKESSSELTCSLTNSSSDSIAGKYIPEAFHQQNLKDYIRCTVTKARDTTQVQRFQDLLCLLLYRWVLMLPSYLQLYETLLPSQSTELKRFVSKWAGMPFQPAKPIEETALVQNDFSLKYKNILKSTGYKTSCRPKVRMPNIISKEEAEHLEPAFVLQFPKDDDTEVGDKIPKEYLTCPDEKYPFPGVIALAGGNVYLPCCFNKDPRKSKAYLEYFGAGKKVASKGTEHIKSEYQIIKTFKDVGRLPLLVQQYMTCITSVSSSVPTTFFRAGTIDNPSSILYSIRYALDTHYDPTEEEIVNCPDRKSMLERFHNDALDLCRQENYDVSNKEVSLHIRDMSVYMDPSRYICLLEEFYNINIVVFSRAKTDGRISLIVPRNKTFHVRYDFRPNRPFIFLYEHWGTSPTRYTPRAFPVCELLFAGAKDNRMALFHFANKSESYRQLHRFYSDYYRVYPNIAKATLLPAVRTKTSSIVVVGQLIDDWGKMRGLFVEGSSGTEKSVVYIESFMPLPPLYIPAEQLKIVRHTSIWTPDQVERHFGSRIKKWVRFRGPPDSAFVSFAFSGHMWKTQIPLNTMRVSLVTEEVLDPYILHDSSYVRSSRTSPSANTVPKRIARMIMDYAIYLYAKHGGLSGNVTLDHVRQFLDERTTVVPGHRYSDETHEAIDANPTMCANNHIILQSDSMKHRLAFVLLYNTHYNLQEVREQKRNTYLQHYWETIWDFEHWRFISYIPNYFSKKTIFLVDYTPLNTLTKNRGYWFYFLQRPLLDRLVPYMYVHVKNVLHACAVSTYWKANKVLPEYGPDESIGSTEGFNIVSYNIEQGLWQSESEIGQKSPEETVFVFSNHTQQQYVLLDLSS